MDGEKREAASGGSTVAQEKTPEATLKCPWDSGFIQVWCGKQIRK